MDRLTLHSSSEAQPVHDENCLGIKLGATDKPCGVRTVANPKLLLNGT